MSEEFGLRDVAEEELEEWRGRTWRGRYEQVSDLASIALLLIIFSPFIVAGWVEREFGGDPWSADSGGRDRGCSPRTVLECPNCESTPPSEHTAIRPVGFVYEHRCPACGEVAGTASLPEHRERYRELVSGGESA